ncbi:MAG: acyltransferase [Candidatus Cohnella colombiensis]|uniref:Acyltransferase n=1 Tax=Candidatus Cohnella colombiensis TaxID=3121368 RepID=A0AA95ETW9_9BACL|nr:MAG: acyltransferase [Cohnella sp.]
MNQRFIQLDSLRGLAALAVLFSHIILIPESMGSTMHSLLTAPYSPFQILVDGHSAVILFFVLSGFVLSLPLLNGKYQSYHGYLIKRFFRIYVPYIISFFVALTLLSLSPKLTGVGISESINNTWSQNLSMSVIVEHILGIVNVHTEAINSPYWSLVHEMRISIIFPFVVFLLRNVRWYYTVLIGLALFGFSTLNDIFNIQTSNGLNTTYFDSLHYLSFFLYGMLLAKHRIGIVDGFRALKNRFKYSVLAISLICYNCSYGVIVVLNKLNISVPFDRSLREQVVAIGVAGFVIIVLSSSRVGNVLKNRIPVFLGNVSYSLYLYHMIIMLAFVHGFAGKVPLGYLLLASIVISLVVAYAMWRFVEKPAMAIGKRLATRMTKKVVHPNKEYDAA